jgi:hypothetical protein
MGNEQKLKDTWGYVKSLNMCVTGDSEEERDKRIEKKI